VPIKTFNHRELLELWQPHINAGKFEGGQVTIIGGSKLFHGAPILALKAASRIVDMVYFSSPKEDKSVAEQVKGNLNSFIWIPREDLDQYVAKSDAVLIGPGLMRFGREGHEDTKKLDTNGQETKNLTERLLKKFPDKHWVVDGGSLQVIRPDILPPKAIITPNRKEFMLLFGEEPDYDDSKKTAAMVSRIATKYNLTIVTKGPTSVVSNGVDTYLVTGGNAGLIKGGTGDIIAGLAAAFLAKNSPLLSAATAVYLVKRAAEDLTNTQALMYNADDLADQLPKTFAIRLRKP
jgi:NAD(P)H-hydrate epimerase